MTVDLRAALRALANAPAFAAGSILTLAVALGLVTTAVGLLFGALGEPGAVSRPDLTLLYLTEQVSGREQRMRWPYAAIELLRQRAKSFERIASYTTATLNFAGAGSAGERLDIELASPDYLEILGVAPAIGRPIAFAGSERQLGPDEILISDGLWQRLGGAPDVVGQTVRLSGRPVTVVGILPPEFRGLSGRASLIAPHSLAPVISNADYFTSQEYFHNLVAQLAAGISIEQARSELAVIAGGMAATIPPRSDHAVGRSAEIEWLRDARTSPQAIRARALVTAGAVLVLVIAAVNVGNLVVARITARSREFAMRLAVGATRRRVFGTIAMEMGLVTAAGFGAAFLVAIWARDLLESLVPSALQTPANDYGQLATLSGVRLDTPVVIASAGLAVVTMVLISALACRPIFSATLADVLKRGGSRGGLGPGGAQRLLLMAQVAVSIALLTSAGLLFRTVAALDAVDPGFDASNVMAFSVAEDLSAQRPDSGPMLAERLLEAVAPVPGVVAATVGQCTPYAARCARLALQIEDGAPAASAPPIVGWHRVGPDHFAALRIPVLSGRGFTRDDRRGRPAVVVINEEAARRFFPDRSPIGQRVRLPQVLAGESDSAEIVGVVGNVVYWPANEPPGPDVYQPALQFAYPWTTMMVRTAREPAMALPDIREAIRRADPNLPLYDVVSLADLGRRGRADQRFMSLLLATCAGLGLLLAMIGAYALSAGWMAARRRELALRVALGAEPSRLVGVVMRASMVHTLAGLAAGLLASLAAGRLFGSMLFGVAPNDPLTLVSAGAVMLAVSVSAAYVPARRAARIDPIRELNAE